MKRPAIRTAIRLYLHEDTANLFSDAQLNQAITDALVQLPEDGVCLQEIYTQDQVLNQIDYPLPVNTIEIEEVNINVGTAVEFNWVPVGGWEPYGDVLYLRQRPTTVYPMQIKVRRGFTPITDDTTDTDVPDNKITVLVMLSTLFCYEMIMGYFMATANWDSIAKPDGIDMMKVLAWIKELKAKYNDIKKKYKKSRKPGEIDLTG